MIIWVIACLCAFFIKGLCGFANTLVFSSILSFKNYNIHISPIELLLGYPTNVILAFKERRSIQWHMCIPLATLVLLGSLPGAFLLKITDTHIIKIIFGFVIILIGLEMLIREFHPTKTTQSNVVLIIIGILSGVLCGLYGIGALLGAYISRVTDNSSSFKANICVVFFVENTFRIIVYTLSGILTLQIFTQAVKLMPLMLTGLLLGMFSSKKLPESVVKRIVIIMLIISGIALVINSLI